MIKLHTPIERVNKAEFEQSSRLFDQLVKEEGYTYFGLLPVFESKISLPRTITENPLIETRNGLELKLIVEKVLYHGYRGFDLPYQTDIFGRENPDPNCFNPEDNNYVLNVTPNSRGRIALPGISEELLIDGIARRIITRSGMGKLFGKKSVLLVYSPMEIKDKMVMKRLYDSFYNQQLTQTPFALQQATM